MTVARRYAAALLELVPPGADRDSLLQALATLRPALQDTEVQAALANPRLSQAQRLKLANTLAKVVKAPQPLANLLGVVAQHGRLAELPEVLDAVQAQARTAAGILVAEVHSAVALTDAQRIQLKVQLKAATKAKDVVLREQVLPALQGGLRVLFNGKVWDASVAGRMARLKAQLRHAAADA